jgi:hypothetical protein
MVRDKVDGGVGMPHVAGKCRALFMERLKRLYCVEIEGITQPWIGYGI